MKKIYFLLVLLTGITNAQTVTIPDVNFKNKLIALGVDTNTDGQIQVSEALAVSELTVYNSNIASLEGITAFANLSNLEAGNNQLTTLDLSGMTALFSINVSGNQLTAIQLTGCIALGHVAVNSNQLQSLDVSGILMQRIWVNNNPLTQLNITGCTALEELDLSYTSLSGFSAVNYPQLIDLNIGHVPELASLTVANCPQLISINAPHCQLPAVAISGCPLLNSLDLTQNQLTTVDVSNCPTLYSLYLDGNPLISLFAKTGSNIQIDLGQILTLEYICINESQVVTMQNYVTMFEMYNTVVNSYCFFEPGGNYNTISGTVRHDANADGCNAEDSAFRLMKLKIANGATQGTTFADASGEYDFFTPAGNSTLTPEVENPTYFSIFPPTATINFANANGNTATQNFCVSANGVHPDLEMVLIPAQPAQPGFDASYVLVYRNKGNQTLSGTLTFGYNDALIDFVSATATPDTQSTGLLSWNYVNLLPFETRTLAVTLNVNGPMETPPVNLNDVLDFTASITPLTGDETPLDNSFELNQVVVGAFDPNNKVCLEGAVVSPDKIGGYLHYVINFENTGTAAAEKVVVKDIIDATKFDIATLQVLQMSHPAVTRITGNKVEFLFDNIDLGPNEHGNVTFKIKTKNTLVTGNSVTNKADIFFDYNFPVETDPATTIFQALQNEEFALDASVSVYPNPSAGIVNIKAESILQSVQVFDAQGRMIQIALANDSQLVLDVSAFHSGIYFIKVRTDKGVKTEKLLKQ